MKLVANFVWCNAYNNGEVGERYGEIEYSGGKVLQRWRGSAGNVRLSHLLRSFLFLNLSSASD